MISNINSKHRDKFKLKAVTVFFSYLFGSYLNQYLHSLINIKLIFKILKFRYQFLILYAKN